MTLTVASDRSTDELEVRRLFLVPPCEADHEGELTVDGVGQARALGDALADVPLRAVYAGPGRSAEDTAAVIAQRHGLVVRKKPAFGLEPSDGAASRVVEAFEAVARASSSRTSLLVVPVEAVRFILEHCEAASSRAGARIASASISEISLDEGTPGYRVERVGDTAHLSRPPAAHT